MEKLFANKVALVTGASKGIGRATALLFASLGAKVIINYNHSEADAQLTQQLILNLGRTAFLEQADVSNLDSVNNMLARISEYTHHIDILINNAGINDKNYIRYMKEDQWDKVIDTNLKGAFNCSKGVLKSMMKRQSGTIVNVSSIMAYKSGIQQAHYAASKAGLVAFTKATAKEVGRFGIRVNAVAPGPVYTSLNDMTVKEAKTVIDLIPLQRIGQPQEIANIIAFLCSDFASYITGEVIIADGGLTV